MHGCGALFVVCTVVYGALCGSILILTYFIEVLKIMKNLNYKWIGPQANIERLVYVNPGSVPKYAVRGV